MHVSLDNAVLQNVFLDFLMSLIVSNHLYGFEIFRVFLLLHPLHSNLPVGVRLG